MEAGLFCRDQENIYTCSNVKGRSVADTGTRRTSERYGRPTALCGPGKRRVVKIRSGVR
jgi:hypothetical protein